MSGFYDDELQFRMTGIKGNRPSSPHKKKVTYILLRKCLKKLLSMMTLIEGTTSLAKMTQKSKLSENTISKFVDSIISKEVNIF